MQYRGRRTTKMKTIRNNVFETNSSSTHSITIVDLEDFEKLEECEMLLDDETLVPANKVYDKMMKNLVDMEKQMTENYSKTYKDTLTYENFIKIMQSFSYGDLSYSSREDCSEDIANDIMAVKAGLNYEVTTYSCLGGEYYETFEDRHTTKHGDTVVAFGYYGSEG